MAKFLKSARVVFLNEGGLSVNTKDSGNWSSGKVGKGHLIGTNWGISAIMLGVFLKRPLIAQDRDTMRKLAYDVALQIKKTFFWDKILGDFIINQAIADLLLDCYFWKPKYTIEWVRNILGTSGNVLSLSRAEINLINGMNPAVFYNRLKQERLNYIEESSNPTYKNGWVNRTNKFNAYPNMSLTHTALVQPTNDNFKKVGIIAAVLLIGFFISKS